MKQRKSKEIKIMINQGKFEDLYLKYGEKTYKSNMTKIMYKDVYNETNNRFLALVKCAKYDVRKVILPTLLSFILTVSASSVVGLMGYTDNKIKENEKNYSNEIDEYDLKNKLYAKEINKLDLNDLEVIMKVMNDEWEHIDGYGIPKKDILGFYRLDFIEDNQAGVCRNIADDMTAKLNAINPKYNARNLVVCMDNNEYTFANIDVRYADDYEPGDVPEAGDTMKHIIGNHLITIANIPDTDILLAIDPTNPGIGILKNGNIHTFSTPNGKGISTVPLGNITFGFDHYFATQLLSIKSFIMNNEPIEQLEEQYSVEMQNKILTKIQTK